MRKIILDELTSGSFELLVVDSEVPNYTRKLLTPEEGRKALAHLLAVEELDPSFRMYVCLEPDPEYLYALFVVGEDRKRLRSMLKIWESPIYPEIFSNNHPLKVLQIMTTTHDRDYGFEKHLPLQESWKSYTLSIEFGPGIVHGIEFIGDPRYL
jgi:hypothetical protein